MDSMTGDMVLDGTKLALYRNRVTAWKKGYQVAPITVDMALTRACQMNCIYCYGKLQENKREVITKKVINDTFEDFASLGVQGVSLVSDGESTCSPHLEYAITRGKELGLAMALGTNGALLTDHMLANIMGKLSYIRFNISAGEYERYNDIMRPKDKKSFEKVVANIRYASEYKSAWGLNCTVGMQMVLMPEFEDQIIPLSQMALRLGADYLVIKHCSDDEDGSLGVDYKAYKNMYETLQEAERMSTSLTKIIVKWSKLDDANVRSYKQCYGAPFLIQLSGSGLVAPCGMLFGEKYKKYHIGNITKTRFSKIFKSKKYWDVMRELAEGDFDARTMCGSLCLQHCCNKFLDTVKKTGNIPTWEGTPPLHKEFV